MSTLIDLLNKHSHLTPDEILVRIKANGWIKLSEMTPAQAEKLDDQRCVVGADNGGAEEPFWVVAGNLEEDNWRFSLNGWYTDYNREHSEFWFILYEEYHDGLVPDRFA